MKTIYFNVPIPENESLLVQEDEMNDFYPFPHEHEEYQIMWILEGNGTLIVDNTFHPFQKDDIFLLSPKQSHVFKKDDTTKMQKVRSVSIFFSAIGMLTSLSNFPETQSILDFTRKNPNGFKIPNEHIEEVKEFIKNIKSSNQLDRLVQFLYLLKCLNKVSQNLKPLSFGSTGQKDETSSLRISEICRYIKENFKNNITLEEVASKVYLTPPAFCRYFKKHTGLTFVAYLNEIRLQEACREINSEKFESFASIAYMCGFNSVTNFNRVFRSVIGLSPKQYLSKYKYALYQNPHQLG